MCITLDPRLVSPGLGSQQRDEKNKLFPKEGIGQNYRAMTSDTLILELWYLQSEPELCRAVQDKVSQVQGE